MSSPKPPYLQSAASSPSYNQDLDVPLYEEEENNSNENYPTDNYRTSAKENVYQKADCVPQEDRISPLQPRNAQDFDQSHVHHNAHNNLGEMIIVRQEDNAFNPTEVYHNPPQAMDSDVIFDSPSQHHQENSNTFYPGYQESFTRNMQNSTPVVYESSYRGESSSSHPYQSQKVQNTQNNFGKMRTVQKMENPSIVVNPAGMYSNNQQKMNTNVFYDSPSAHHHENRNFPILNFDDTLQVTNSMNVQNTTPVVYDLPYRGESSSSQPNQHQTVQNHQNNFGRMRTARQVQNPSNVVNPSEIYLNPPQAMDNDTFYGAPSSHHQQNRNFPILDFNDTLQVANSMIVQNNTPIAYDFPHPIQNQTVQSRRRASKRHFDKTPDDQKDKYKEFYDVQEMNTKEVCHELLMKLSQLAISQTVFAEKVLERSQGTFSDLLKKSKPWEDITTGRDTYRRMYMFLKLSDQEMKGIEEMSVAEVQQMMNFPPTTKKEKKTSQTNGNYENEEPKAKRKRIVFDSYQKQIFEEIFKQSPYPSRETVEALAAHLQLPITSVRTWFMNERRREKTKQNTSHLTY